MSKFINSQKLISIGLLSSLFTGGSIAQSISIENANASSEDEILISDASTNDVPIAEPDEAVVVIGDSVTIPVLDNDYDDNDALSISAVEAEGGTAEVVNNEVVFTPGDVPGTYTITYTVTDDADQTATTDITVEVFAYAD